MPILGAQWAGTIRSLRNMPILGAQWAGTIGQCLDEERK